MNSTAPNNREKELFEQALDVSAGAERMAFVQGACGGDAALCARVVALLQAHETAEEFLPQEPKNPATVRLLLPVTEKPGDKIGHYRLREKIGEGGCGIVYVAEQEEPIRRRVALKVIKLGMDTREVVARFEAERQALAMMDHPNIARVFDGGATDTGRPYFVLELVRGVRITDFCDQHRLPTVERLKLFIQVCHAIQHAHQKGIIHRDIKPSNILVSLHDDVPVPKVIDFGIAKAVGERLTDKTLYTRYEQFMGTPAYMSPEQAGRSDLDVDTRSDIYALGVLLYELLAGRPPFDPKQLAEAGLEEMVRCIREQEPLRPSTRLSKLQREELTTTAQRRGTEPPKLIHLLRGDLDWIVMKCLEKNRTRRYEAANALARDIECYLSHEPITARPPSTAYRAGKFVRRNKVMVGAGAAVGAALVLGIVGSTWQAVRATRAEREQSRQRQRAEAESGKAERAVAAEKQQRLEAQRHLYAANMNLAQQAWEQNNIPWLRQLLEDTQGSPGRGFEWYYWQRQTHLALKTLRGHLDIVRSVAFSPDGQRIVTGSGDQTAKVWEAASGREMLALKGHSAAISSVAVSPDGQRIVTGSFDRTAKVWEAASGRDLLTLKGHSDRIHSVAFSLDGQRIVTGSLDRTAKVWEAASGRELLTHQGHSSGINSGAFSPDGQRIVTGSDDQTAKVWEAASGRDLLTLKGHSGAIRSVAFSPDGQRIVTGSEDQTAKVWEAASGRELLTLKGHSGGIGSVAFSPDGQRIVTGSFDRTAKVWEAASGRELLTLRGHSAQIWSVTFSPDGQRIVSGSGDQTAKVWEVASGRELPTLKGHRDQIWSVAFSPDGQRIVTGSDDQTAKVWEAATGRELLTLKGQSAGITSVAFSPDGQRIVTGSYDKTAKVWEAASGRELLTLKGHSGWTLPVAFSPDGQRIVSGSGDQTAKVWETASGRELLTLKGHSSLIWSVAFSPDGQRIVSGSGDQTAKVWEAASGRELLTLKGHSAAIRSVAFFPDGQRIVTGSSDQTAKVWEAASGRELLTLKGHSAGILSVAFSPDGQRIVTGSSDQTARVWEAARAEQVAAWQQEERAAAQSLAALQRERIAEQERQRMARARDEGAIKRWLILAAIPLAAGQSGAEGLEVEQIEGEGRLRRTAGETSTIKNGELKWQEVALEDYAIDFNAILGRVTPQSVAYAVCYIRSEAEQRGLQMLVGSDDEAKVYLNGKQVHKHAMPRSFVADQDMVPDITLDAGLNVLVFKVVNESSDWKGSIRFTDAAGQPLKGICVTLDPEAKD